MTYTKKMSRSIYLKSLAYLLIYCLTGYLIILFLISKPFNNIIFLLFGYAYGLFIFPLIYWIIKNPMKDYKKWKKGAESEKRVSRYLKEELVKKGNYVVIDSVIFEKNEGDIDHIVIGNTGVFVIETKSHDGNILFDGDEWKQEHTKVFSKSENIHRNKIGNPSQRIKSKLYYLKEFFGNVYPDLHEEWINCVIMFENENVVLNLNEKPSHCDVFKDKVALVNFIVNNKRHSDFIKSLSKEKLVEIKKSIKKNSY